MVTHNWWCKFYALIKHTDSSRYLGKIDLHTKNGHDSLYTKWAVTVEEVWINCSTKAEESVITADTVFRKTDATGLANVEGNI